MTAPSHFMHLISSKIVPAGANAFWEPLPAEWQSLTPRQLLVLTQPYAPGSTAEATLGNMLRACKLTAADYHILMLQPDQRVAWHGLQAAMQPRYALLLGIPPEQLGIAALLRPYEANAFGGCTFITAASLPELEQYPDARKQLWTGVLKPVFADQI